jgi:hypothetical protein
LKIRHPELRSATVTRRSGKGVGAMENALQTTSGNPPMTGYFIFGREISSGT